MCGTCFPRRGHGYVRGVGLLAFLQVVVSPLAERIAVQASRAMRCNFQVMEGGTDMLIDRSSIREGMTVFSSDGEKLGKVAVCGGSTFTIEKGFFFPKDYIARYDEIAVVSGDEIRLSMMKEDFIRMRESGTYGYDATTSGASHPTSARSESEDIRVPVAEEELDVVKRDRAAGEVRLRKDVVTETKHLEVPVTREEVRVERTPVSERREALPGEKAFEKDSISMPIREEEVEVRKRPVVKEEVRLKKERVTEQRAAEADVRKERVDIEGEGARRVDDDPSTRATTRRDPYTGAPIRDDDELP
jgi:uncharacterized protein (TIGR02271 family)